MTEKKHFFAGEWCLIYFYLFSSLPGIFHVALKTPNLMPMTFQVSRSLDLSESPCAKIRLGHPNAAKLAPIRRLAMLLLPTTSFAVSQWRGGGCIYLKHLQAPWYAFALVHVSRIVF